MSHHSKVLWGEGLFLRPQHFQQQDAYHEALSRQSLLTAQPFGWGLRALEIDTDALAGGTLRIERIDAVLPNGERYLAPDVDRLPPPLDLAAIAFEDSSTEFRLALQHLHAHGGNCRAAESGADTARYAIDNRTVGDLFTDAAEAELPFLVKSAILKAATEPSDAYLTLPLLRLRKTPANGYEKDPGFVAPALTLAGAPLLQLQLRRLLDALQAKINALYGFHREPSKHIIEFRSGDIASFWLLHTASSAYAALSHLHRNPKLHPERLFQELLRLAGGLMTFSKAFTVGDLPAYDHAAPGPAFLKLDHLLRELLETVISTRYFAIALTQPKPAFHVGRLDSDKITDDTAFYLSVNAAAPAAQLIESVPLQFKIGAPDDVEKLVLSAMSGVRLNHAAQVPPAIPVKPGACYFALDPRNPLYERMLKSGAITIYAPESYQDLELELIAITS
ncbi:type VI secretion system baseplate subunit TssK [Nitrogeniibacter mangrovi]|uniref:Type VI secretion system baseplate subunit TssK n=1 Tax=Nitrogeniibacter mangrovi TaxID=2016596 RepID=A0A6C1B3M5_9RHOO|nr:type VI secretion system baseplate subunit TssK [Nitrogeniibacter mangrovi]QID17448.1 type VI secretion system baseplate subunit TssK [Nitrogeniibacter mangrovi]